MRYSYVDETVTPPPAAAMTLPQEKNRPKRDFDCGDREDSHPPRPQSRLRRRSAFTPVSGRHRRRACSPDRRTTTRVRPAAATPTQRQGRCCLAVPEICIARRAFEHDRAHGRHHGGRPWLLDGARIHHRLIHLVLAAGVGANLVAEHQIQPQFAAPVSSLDASSLSTLTGMIDAA